MLPEALNNLCVMNKDADQTKAHRLFALKIDKGELERDPLSGHNYFKSSIWEPAGFLWLVTKNSQGIRKAHSNFISLPVSDHSQTSGRKYLAGPLFHLPKHSLGHIRVQVPAALMGKAIAQR